MRYLLTGLLGFLCVEVTSYSTSLQELNYKILEKHQSMPERPPEDCTSFQGYWLGECTEEKDGDVRTYEREIVIWQPLCGVIQIQAKLYPIEGIRTDTHSLPIASFTVTSSGQWVDGNLHLMDQNVLKFLTTDSPPQTFTDRTVLSRKNNVMDYVQTSTSEGTRTIKCLYKEAPMASSGQR